MRKLRTVLTTAVAVVVMSMTVFAGYHGYSNVYVDKKTDFVKGGYTDLVGGNHVVTAEYQYCHYSGDVSFQITKKVALLHVAQANATIYHTNKYGGVICYWNLYGTVDNKGISKDRYYRIKTDDAVQMKLTKYYENY